jgi:hypothetical protein
MLNTAGNAERWVSLAHGFVYLQENEGNAVSIKMTRDYKYISFLVSMFLQVIHNQLTLARRCIFICAITLASTVIFIRSYRIKVAHCVHHLNWTHLHHHYCHRRRNHLCQLRSLFRFPFSTVEATT